MRLIILIFLSFCFWMISTPNVHAQVVKDYKDISIFMGDKKKSKGYIESFSKTPSGKIICVQNQSNLLNLFSKIKANRSFGYVEDYTLPQTKYLKFYGDGRRTDLASYAILGEHILAVSYRSDFASRNDLLYYHFIDPSSDTRINHGFSIPEDFSRMYKNINISRLILISSEDASYSSIMYLPNTTDAEFTQLNYLLFASNSEVPVLRGINYPYSTNNFNPLDFFIFNPDNQFLIAAHYNDKELAKTKAYEFDEIKITQLKDKELHEWSIREQGIYFSDTKCYPSENGFTIVSLYKYQINGEIQGVLIAKMDKEGNILNKYFTPFNNETLTYIRSATKFNAGFNLDFEPSTHNFKLIDFYAIGDNYYGIIEYKATEYRYGGAAMPNGAGSIDRYYWCNDLIAFGINKRDSTQWFSLIPKLQRTVNDGGYYLSATSYLSDNHLHIFFNDNLSNYNKDGDFIKDENTSELAQFNAVKNTITHVSIDCTNGNVTRKSTIGRYESNIIFTPSLSVPIPERNTLFINGNNLKNYRLGNIFFNKEK
ncbi:MAG: hypothetical protein H3C31_07275 [Brumimicrobium sp.]|nr:hypothetical protein [Brumimicrobium sp.]